MPSWRHKLNLGDVFHNEAFERHDGHWMHVEIYSVTESDLNAKIDAFVDELVGIRKVRS